VRAHLYEFRNDNKKLKCLCGWERTLKTSDPKIIQKTFDGHCDEMAEKAGAR
jgi:hypothetical protein